MCVCITVGLSVVRLAVRRGSDAPGYPCRGEDGGSVGGQGGCGGRQDPGGGAGRCRAARVGGGVESRGGPKSTHMTSCEKAVGASVCMTQLCVSWSEMSDALYLSQCL